MTQNKYNNNIMYVFDYIYTQMCLFYYTYIAEPETEDEFKVLNVSPSPSIEFDYNRFAQ